MKKEIKNVLNDTTQYVVEESNLVTEQTATENKPEICKSTRILEKKETKNVYEKEEKETYIMYC